MTKPALTPKQEAFLRAYLETGNAAEAYRRSYDIKKMSAITVSKRACELLAHGGIAGRLAELRKQAAAKVALDRAWVLERLMANAEIALGNKKTRKTVKGSGEDSTLGDVEVFDRDAAAANAALKLLGQLPEVGLFSDDQKGVNVNITNNVPTPQAPDADRIAEIVKRFAVPQNADGATGGFVRPVGRKGRRDGE